MSTTINARDVLLAAATERITALGDVSWSDITGAGKPSDYADVTQEAFEQGISVTQVTGGLRLHDAGAIRAGQLDWNVGTGFYLGYTNGGYKFSLGSPTGNAMVWDGTNLTLRGNLDFSYVQNGPPSNADRTQNALGATVPISSGGITMLGGGSIKGGQSDFNVGNGFFLGWSVNNYKLSLGTPSGNRMTWDGTTLLISGNIIGGSLRIGAGTSANGYGLEFQGNGNNLLFVESLQTRIFVAQSLQNSILNNPAVMGISNGNAYGVYGQVASSTTYGGNSIAVRGYNSPAGGNAGMIAGPNAYDFYADGAGTNYGPFTGTHDGLVPNADVTSFEPGHIVIDDELQARSGWSSTIFSMVLSSVPNQPGALGVICADPKDMAVECPPAAFVVHHIQQASTSDTIVPRAPQSIRASVKFQEDIILNYKHIAVNAVGEGQLWVCGEGGDISRGDLIVTSSMPGKGMKQADGFVRHYTVAKARENVNFSGPTDVQRCACIYLCG